jgi:phosphate starvation-inducible protein PhoH
MPGMLYFTRRWIQTYLSVGFPSLIIAKDKGASSPAYAVKILLNAVHTGKEPGYKPGKSKNGADPAAATDYDALKAYYAPKHLEDLIEH